MSVHHTGPISLRKTESKAAFEQLEYEFSEWAKLKNCVACCNGTAALCLAIQALDLPPQSEILVPELTMVACARAVVLAGHVPVFVDCDSKLLLNVKLLEEKVTPKTKAVMPVHIYGRKCNLAAIQTIAKRHELKVIEDCAEFHIPRTASDPIPDAACYSFYANKVIHGEEGGMIAFRDKPTADRARQIRCLGFTHDHDFLHVPGGFNWRLSNCHAELILDSLRQVQSSLEKRKAVESWYNQIIPQQWQLPKRPAVWVYDLRVKGMTYGTQSEVVRELNRQGIAARHCFKPMSMQPEFLRDFHSLKAYALSKEILYVPISESMTRDETEHIANRTIEAAQRAVVSSAD